MTRELNGGTNRSGCLHENFARCFASSGPTRDLSEQLKGSLPSAEIGHVKRQVGINDSDQGDVWKMKTFSDHLRSYEDVDFTGAETAQRFAIRVFSCHGIRVHP